jgi:hypothetical protein
LVSLLILFPMLVVAQPSTEKIVRAFPITDYMVDLNDSIKIVQVFFEQTGVIREKEMGVVATIFNPESERPDIIGSGRCNMIKGDYYYFTINFKGSGSVPVAGDLLYTSVAKPAAFTDVLSKIASHYITLKDVYDSPFYDRFEIFNSWSAANEKAALDSMIADIIYTADYFLKNDPSLNVNIKSGANADKPVLNIMKTNAKKELEVFLNYMIAHPGIYAGKDWKISEIFATWVTEGSPKP